MSERVKQILKPKHLFFGILFLGVAAIGLSFWIDSVLNIDTKVFSLLFMCSVFTCKMQLDLAQDNDSTNRFFVAMGIFILGTMILLGYVFVSREMNYSLLPLPMTLSYCCFRILGIK